MELFTLLIVTGTAALTGLILGYALRWLITLSKRGSIELEVKKTILEAKAQAQKIIEQAEEETTSALKDLRIKEREKELELKKKEERLLRREDLLDKRQSDVGNQAEELKQRIKEAEERESELAELKKKGGEELHRLSRLSAEDARGELFARLERAHSEDLIVRMRKLESEAEEKLEQRAREILTSTIQRLTNSAVAETLTTAVEIPSDDVKGKIIGKEGRNIRAFEKATGVEIIIDDTPGTVTLSSFDPTRRQVAKTALENLIASGRIQPAKIEEAVERAKEDVAEIIRQKGEEAAFEARVFNLDPRILLILGRLHFRTSYNQNVLRHSVEVAHLAGMLAEELGADATVARAGALLHDIGKAIDHEVPGTHVEIGQRILEKFGANELVIKAMRSHHGEYPYETLEAVIVQTADAISGGRPGARRDTVENYLKRLKELEDLANSFVGIEKSYAIEAGREIRVFVKPEDVSDLGARKLAREIAMRIEQELRYPGEIRVTVIRENRVVEYAR